MELIDSTIMSIDLAILLKSGGSLRLLLFAIIAAPILLLIGIIWSYLVKHAKTKSAIDDKYSNRIIDVAFEVVDTVVNDDSKNTIPEQNHSKKLEKEALSNIPYQTEPRKQIIYKLCVNCEKHIANWKMDFSHGKQVKTIKRIAEFINHNNHKKIFHPLTEELTYYPAGFSL